MPVLEILETVDRLPKSVSDSGHYNLSRLIELCPDAMPADCFHKVARPKESAQDVERRRSRETESYDQLPLQSLSQDTQEYIEKLVEQRSQAHYRQAHFDALTHLPNRAHFQHHLHETIIQSKNQSFALLFLDLDGFKAVNDTLSHQVGDELLQLVSARLQSAVREDDFISRLGGDEFCILVDETNRENLQIVCDRIISEVSRGYWIQNTQVSVSTSIGIALYPQDAKFANDLINYADQALYFAKHSGKKQARLYEQLKQEQMNHAKAEAQSFSMERCQVGFNYWHLSEAMEQPRSRKLAELVVEDSRQELKRSQVFKAISKCREQDCKVLAKWVWDSADFYLQHPEAVEYHHLVIQVPAQLLNHLPLSEPLPEEAASMGLKLTESDFQQLNSQGRSNLHKLLEAGGAIYCDIEEPWAFDWSLVDRFSIRHLCLQESVCQALKEKPASIRQLFMMSLQSLELTLWCEGFEAADISSH